MRNIGQERCHILAQRLPLVRLTGCSSALLESCFEVVNIAVIILALPPGFSPARTSCQITPTLMLYRKGEKLGEIGGALPKTELEAWIDASTGD